jgi:hypothetical protein
MSKKRSIDSSADARLAREIEDLLAIDPSPEFLARLRTRLAEEPNSSDAVMGAPRWLYGRQALQAMAICAVIAVAALVVSHWPPRDARHGMVAVDKPAETVAIPTVAPLAVALPHPKPRSQPPREVLTEFYPLMDTPPPFERGELVRMSLPVSAVQRAGFPVEGTGTDDSVEADVLIGEEGLARAIRFVSYQQ